MCICIYGAYRYIYIDGSTVQPWHLWYTDTQFLVSRYYLSKDPEYNHPRIPKSKTAKIQKSKHPKIQKSKNPNIQKSKNPEIQKSKNPKIQNFSHLRTLVKKVWIFGVLGCLDFWIFLFFRFWDSWSFRVLDFWISWISGSVALRLCGYLGTRKCISACRRRAGGEHIYIYAYVRTPSVFPEHVSKAHPLFPFASLRISSQAS